jgi:hypothetical protein
MRALGIGQYVWVAGRVHRVLWGTEAGRVKVLAHPVRMAILFGLFLFAWMWLDDSRSADFVFLVADAVGSTVGAIVFVALLKLWHRRRAERVLRRSA